MRSSCEWYCEYVPSTLRTASLRLCASSAQGDGDALDVREDEEDEGRRFSDAVGEVVAVGEALAVSDALAVGLASVSVIVVTPFVVVAVTSAPVAPRTKTAETAPPLACNSKASSFSSKT